MPALSAPLVEPATTTWQYTTVAPAEGWAKADFDASTWKQGPGGFGTEGTPGAIVKTTWNTADIWLRAQITIPEAKYHELQFNLHHDEDAEVYVNGQPAAKVSGFASDYEPVPVGRRATLKPGPSLIAIHCHQTGGGQYIDLGIVDLVPSK